MVKKSTAQAGSGGKPDGGSPAAKPAPLSPQETKRRRIQKILAALGMSAAGLGTYLFQSDDKAPIDPPAARTARFDPSTGEGPDNASPAAMGISSAVPTASFTKQVASERISVEPEASDTDNIYTLEVPVSEFTNVLVDYINNPKFAVRYMPRNYLYSDFSYGPEDNSAALPPGLEPLIIDGKANKRVRVFIKPDGKNPILDYVFGNLDMYIASPNPRENARNQHSLCTLAELIACSDQGIAYDLTDDKNRDMEIVRALEIIVADALMTAFRVLEISTKPVIRDSRTLHDLIASGATTRSESLERLRKEIIASIPDAPLDSSNDDAYSRLHSAKKALRENRLEDVEPTVLAGLNALRRIALVITNPTLKREDTKSHSR